MKLTKGIFGITYLALRGQGDRCRYKSANICFGTRVLLPESNRRPKEILISAVQCRKIKSLLVADEITVKVLKHRRIVLGHCNCVLRSRIRQVAYSDIEKTSGSQVSFIFRRSQRNLWPPTVLIRERKLSHTSWPAGLGPRDFLCIWILCELESTARVSWCVD